LLTNSLSLAILKIFLRGRTKHRRQPLTIGMGPPTDAMGDSSLFFVLGFLGQQKIGSASALSGFPLENFLRGRIKQRRNAGNP
jgi:hypothetical protein